MAPRSYFPAIAPFANGMLDVGDGHQIYWEECGNPEGQAILCLHGGPGTGCVPTHRRFFDPDHYRIILFDQRGAGRSTPFAGLEANNTQKLVSDIEALRQARAISRWLLFGGSWGSTLALAYGEHYPQHCLGFILRGIFLGSAREIDWFLHGMGRFFPEAYDDFLQPLRASPAGDVGNGEALLARYYDLLTDPDASVHLPAAQAWSSFEGICSTLVPDYEGVSASLAADQSALSIARLEAHYFSHHCFLQPQQLLQNIAAIRHLPAIIIHGRHDVVCLAEAAYQLYHCWPSAELQIIDNAGHAASEPGIRTALLAATEQFKKIAE